MAIDTHPGRKTVLLIGDGTAQLTVQHLRTFSEGLSPVIVLANNDGYIVKRAIHGESGPYNDIVSWKWTDIPNALGAGGQSQGVSGADLRRARRRIHCGLGESGPHGIRKGDPASTRNLAPPCPTRWTHVTGGPPPRSEAARPSA